MFSAKAASSKNYSTTTEKKAGTASKESQNILEESNGYLLWQLSNLWQKKLNQELQRIDLTHVQYILLSGLEWFYKNKQEVNQSQLAIFVNTDVMMTSNVLRTLEKKQLIERKNSAADTRSKQLVFTKKGLSTLRTARTITARLEETFFNNGDEDRFSRQLKAYLQK